MSGLRSRRKGLAGEREVASAFKASGWMVRGLEGSGDWLALPPMQTGPSYRNLPAVHVECKRAERLRLPEWLAQAAREAPPGVPAVVCFRQSRGEWFAALRLADLLELVA